MVNDELKSIVTTVHLRLKHKQWLRNNSISLSKYVQKKIEEDMTK